MSIPIPKLFEEALDEALKAGAKLSDLSLVIGGEGQDLLIDGFVIRYSEYIQPGTAFLLNRGFRGQLPPHPFHLSDDQKIGLEQLTTVSPASPE